MKRSYSFIAVFALLVGLLFGISAPGTAEASVSWPLEVSSNVYGLTTASNDEDILFTNCGGPNAAERITADEVRHDPSPASTDLFCGETAGSNLVSKDGTVYQVRYNASPSLYQLAAVKNGRIKWTKNLKWFDSCSYLTPESLSIGGDGNIYFVTASYGGCSNYVVGVDAYTGAELPITHNIGGWAVNGQVKPEIWTYDDMAIVMEPSGLKRVYYYDSGEDTDKAYQFDFDYRLTGQAYANENGRVFVVVSCGGGEILYSDINGDDGGINRSDCGNTVKDRFVVGPDGTIVSYHPLYGSIATWDPTNSLGALSYLTTRNYSTLGYMPQYSEGIADLKVDEDSNVLVSMTYTTSNTGATTTTAIEYIDAATNTPSVLLSLTGNGTPEDRPAMNGQTGLVHDGFLYLPITHGMINSSYNSYIHKTDITSTDFGTPVPQGPGFAEPIDKLEYVAMGDSFSSGEGVEPFITGSATDGTNECHRSEDAYPVLLAQDEDLDLTLTDFVACSGATTQNVLHGGSGEGAWDEPAQIDALSDSTKVVTITIGGNDVAFADYMQACVATSCGPVTNPLIFDAMIDGINSPAFEANLVTTYEAIIEAAPNAQVYVISYPQMILPPRVFCNSLDASGAAEVLSTLNNVVYDAVAEVQLLDDDIHYVNSSNGGSPFEGGELCEGNPLFNELDVFNIEYSYHPNQDGQEAFKIILKGILD